MESPIELIKKAKLNVPGNYYPEMVGFRIQQNLSPQQKTLNVNYNYRLRCLGTSKYESDPIFKKQLAQV